MKKLLLAILLVGSSVSAQNPILTDTTWYLTSLVQNGNVMTPPSSDPMVPNVPLAFMPGSTSFQMMTSVCNTAFTDPVSFPTEDTFTYQFLGVTLIVCDSPASAIFENAYLGFYGSNANLPLSYVITGQANEYVLTVTSTAGDVAVYSSTLLGNSTPANRGFAVSPNPTNGQITLAMEHSGEVEISLFNALGQKVLSQKHQSLPEVLDISNFEAGIYVLEISGANGKASKKIVKI